MNRIIIVIVLCVSFGIAANAQTYEAIKGKLMTRWGKEVTPENAWKEYPRPQLKRENWQNLNGLWEYAIISKDDKKPENFQGNILVPFAVESALSGVGKSVLPEDKVWYRKTFQVNPEWKGKNIVLHFQAVDWESTVWLNGKLIGTHKGGSTAFSFDITKYLKKGEQELIVSVWDPTDDGMQPRGKQVLKPRGIWYTPVTGIWQTVWMEPVNKVTIQTVNPVADIDNSQLILDTKISVLKGNEEIKVSVFKDSEVVTEKIFKAADKIVLDIPSPKLWSPETPELYQMTVSLTKNGALLDEVDSYFAMRKISMVKDENGFQRIQLNNETIFQYGTLDQGWWPDGLLTPPSAEAMRYDMEVLKDMGFNMLRKHIKVEPWTYYYYADSLGLLIWQDMVSGFKTAERNEQHVKWDAESDWSRPKESADQVLYEMKEEIDQLKFFPSIVTWVIFNEGWGQFETKKVVDWSMEYDPTRIIDGVSGWTDRNCGNMYDVHQYPGPGMEPAAQNPGRVMVLGEFGGLGLPLKDHLWNPEMRNWGYRTYSSTPELIKEYAKLMYSLVPLKYKGLSAAVYTQTTDVEGEVNGLMTYDREVVKIDPELLRILHAPLYGKDNKKVVGIITDSEVVANDILYTKSKPSADWKTAPELKEFKSLKGPIEQAKSESIWSVKAFNLSEIPEGISLKISAFGQVKVYLNGKLVLDKRIIGKRHYEYFNISDYVGYLKKGENLLTIEAPDAESKAPFDYGFFGY
ncbi:sugar-binding domain-containing protein [Sunxiuqinia sp. A32]|uniref:sugar-binding domain-containing protein n=1 Tax=Sunxiuqinia sp. A32 TaxID=3461496 RepID=UPI004046328A